MAWWWAGNIIWLVVVIPAVIFLLNRLLRVVQEIRQYADDVLEHGVLLIAAMDHLDALGTTRDAVARIREGAGAYVAALQELA